MKARVFFAFGSRSGRGGMRCGKDGEHGMKVTDEQIAARYASMTDEELKALDPAKLTAEAAALRAEELKRRGVSETPAEEAKRVRFEREREAQAGRRRRGQLIAVALVVASLAAELVLPRFVEVPDFLLACVVVVLCVLALWAWRGKS